MKAWYIERYGGPEVIQFGDLPEPVPGPRDLLVAIRAASVNPIDWKMRAGATRAILRPGFPLVLGNDFAGVVSAIGEDVQGFGRGDRVFARPDKHRIGAFAERIAVRADEVAPMPASLDFVEAAALPLVGLTCLQALDDIARLKSGQKVLVHAGAGGVGSFAIQYAKHLGAHVAATASAPKHALLRGLGADEVIDYRSRDFSKLISAFDVVLDTLGGKTLKRSVRVLRPGGVIVSVAGPPGPEFAREWGLGRTLRALVWLMSIGIRLRARRVGGRYRFFIMHADGAQLREIAELVDEGAIRPVIDSVFDFDRADEAIAKSEAGHATGKVVIRVAESR